jgi:hypothetical protein
MRRSAALAVPLRRGAGVGGVAREQHAARSKAGGNPRVTAEPGRVLDIGERGPRRVTPDHLAGLGDEVAGVGRRPQVDPPPSPGQRSEDHRRTRVQAPRPVAHLLNAGDEPCRIMEIISPAGFEHSSASGTPPPRTAPSTPKSSASATASSSTSTACRGSAPSTTSHIRCSAEPTAREAHRAIPGSPSETRRPGAQVDTAGRRIRERHGRRARDGGDLLSSLRVFVAATETTPTGWKQNASSASARRVELPSDPVRAGREGGGCQALAAVRRERSRARRRGRTDRSVGPRA